MKTSSSLFQFPPLNLDLHSLFDHNDDTTQLDGKLHLGGTGLGGLGSSLSTGGTSGLGSSSLLDSQLKSNAASEAADDSTSTQGVAGAAPRPLPAYKKRHTNFGPLNFGSCSSAYAVQRSPVRLRDGRSAPPAQSVRLRDQMVQ